MYVCVCIYIYVYIYIYIYICTCIHTLVLLSSSLSSLSEVLGVLTVAEAAAGGQSRPAVIADVPQADPAVRTFREERIQRELRGSQGVGVMSNNWPDRILLSILCMFEPSG